MLEVLDPAGARLELIFRNLELFRDLFCFVTDHGVGQLNLLVSAFVKPLGKL